MLITKYMVSKEQAEAVIMVAMEKHLISRQDYIRIANELNENVFKASYNPLLLIDLRFFNFKDELYELSKKTKVKIDDLDGWYLYDENLWIYDKKNRDEATVLSNPADWFETKRIHVREIEKRGVLVKYPDDIELVLHENKCLYFLKQHIPKIAKKSPSFSLEEVEEYEKIIKITNEKSGTIHFYGVWS